MASEEKRRSWRLHARKWREQNPERARALYNDYYERNREQVSVRRRERRRKRKADLEATLSSPADLRPIPAEWHQPDLPFL